MNLRHLLLPSVLAFSACSSAPKPEVPPERQPAGLFDGLFKSTTEAQPLTDEEIVSVSSSGPLKTKGMKVLVDNDAAFDEKVNAIRSATAGETVRLSYYIYSDDHSSSVLFKELIAAGQRGVKVKIFADLIMNYKYLDLFAYMNSATRGNIQPRFFLSLSPKLVRDLSFLSRPCPPIKGKVTASSCSDAKWAELAQNPESDAYGKLLLSGMLGRSATAVKFAVTEGQQLDVAALAKGGGASKDETQQLIDFLKLVVKSKLQGDSTAGIKVALAYMFYGEKLNPVMNQINGMIPLEQSGDTSFEDWEHITDFTHHKFLSIGERFLQIGGRNVENSYHTKPSPLTQKYIFKDVDASVQITSGGADVTRAFDEFWSYQPLTFSMEDVFKMAPNDFITNIPAATKAVAQCAKGTYGAKRRAQTARCLESSLYNQPEYKNREQRMQAAAKLLDERAAGYATYKKVINESWSKNGDFSGKLSQNDVKKAFVTYIENLHFDRRKPADKRPRVFGVKPAEELNSGKYLHYLWLRGMENVCASTAESFKKNPNQPRQRVILHSAYFLPPGIMMNTLAKMINGTWDCRGVRLTILTNSLETTDLNVINLLGRYQMTAFYNLYSQRLTLFGNELYKDDRSQDPRFNKDSRSNGRAAVVDYFELKSMSDDAHVSLHAKVMILGNNDAMVTSANGDIRSYYMDTNNGLYLRNVPDFVREYTAWLDGMIKDRAKTNSRVKEFTAGGVTVDETLRRLHAEDRAMIDAFMKKRGWDKKVKAAHMKQLHKVIEEVTDMIFDSTRKIMHEGRNEGDDVHERRAKQLKLMHRFDRLLQVF
ncbi:MAG: hypothetical protein KF767_05620 [Bdellovibrionaceae bacterium]|nr:hypothetical protein [Pseudobdellovibrionaceae bacterium]